MSGPQLTVIMPVYNEKPTVLEILRRVRELPVEKEIIVVDNCSTDGTRELVQGLSFSDVKVVLQPRNMMKGNSVKRGMALAQGENVVVQDGDLEYDPQDLLALLQAAQGEEVLAAFGSRVLGARERGQALPRSLHRLGGDFVNWTFRTLYLSPLTDVASCYKMAPREVFHSLDLRRDGFDLDYEIAAKLQLLARRRGLRIAELPISYSPRTVAEGKKITWRDGLRALATVLSCRWWR